MVDIWQANATGYYAGCCFVFFRVCSSHSSFILGHPAPHPKYVDVKPDTEGPRKGLLPPYPRTVHKENWLRGAWPTDKNGVAQFTSEFLIVEFPPRLSALTTFIPFHSLILLAIYPGYYTGRATHVHAKVFPEWIVNEESNTYKSGRLSHVGQFFFDEEINLVIDKVSFLLSPISLK